jgi:hypothetical protein
VGTQAQERAQAFSVALRATHAKARRASFAVIATSVISPEGFTTTSGSRLSSDVSAYARPALRSLRHLLVEFDAVAPAMAEEAERARR